MSGTQLNYRQQIGDATRAHSQGVASVPAGDTIRALLSYLVPIRLLCQHLMLLYMVVNIDVDYNARLHFVATCYNNL